MRGPHDRHARGDRLADKHVTRAVVHAAVAVADVAGVPGDAGDGVVVGRARQRVVPGQPKVRQVVIVHHVADVDVPVGRKVRVRRQNPSIP